VQTQQLLKVARKVLQEWQLVGAWIAEDACQPLGPQDLVAG